MDLDSVDLEDWELLPSEETQLMNNDSGVLIKPDYFDSRKLLIQETSGACSVDENNGIEVSFNGVGEFDVGLIEKSDLQVGFDEIVVRDVGVAESEKIQVGFIEKSDLDDGFGEVVVRNMGFAEKEENEVGFLEQGEMVEGVVVRDLSVVENEEIEVGLVDDIDKSEDLGVGNTNMSEGTDLSFRDELVSGGGGEGDNRCDDVDIISAERESGGEGEKRIMIWWKPPFEFLKYCVLRTSPVWTVSMAAAVIGFVILGRRYYSMKRKSRSVQVKVTVDDKKISQFKSRVVRLNEAFSVVKHVPIIRHSLPAAGVTPWPAMRH